tara:strand:- start:1187 stop:1405 length:219 start_codon:yes stop_codon:yes gene_type:complete
MTIKGVTIGDKFISSKDYKTRNVSTVVDFLEVKSLLTGEVVSLQCIAARKLLGQEIRFETPFSMVIRNKVKS